MSAIASTALLLTQVRTNTNLTQRDLAERAKTTQSAVARIERGQGNPTIETIQRLFAAAGFELRITAVPIVAPDPAIEAYKRDIDRTLLRENLRRSVDERLVMNDEILLLTRELRRRD